MKYLNLPEIETIPIQQEYLMSKARFIAADCGRRSGKTEIAFRRMLRAIIQQHPTLDTPKYLWALPTEEQAKNAIWDKLKMTLQPLQRLGIVTYNGLDVIVQTGKRPDGTPTSSKLLVRGMMNPFRVEGEGYCGVVLDEMCDQPPTAYERSILPAISDRRCNGWAILIGVPKRIGIGAGAFKEICEKWEADPRPQYARFHWTSDIVLSRETLEENRRQMDEKTFREQYFASWETASGLIYYCFDPMESVFQTREIDPTKPLLIGSDFNVSPMSWVVCQEDDEKRVFVLDEISMNDTNTEETLNALYTRYGSHTGGFEFYGDSAARQRHTCASISDYLIIHNDTRFLDARTGRVNIHYPKSNPAILDRVACVNAMLKNAAGERRLFVSKRCKELIKDFEQIAYKENAREMDKRNPKRTHMSDALGYLVYLRHPIQAVKSARLQEIITRG